MNRLYSHDDFEAEVTIFSEADGGRRTPPRNGIRWDLCYASDNPSDGIYCIYPDFVRTTDGERIDNGPLPVGIPMLARFTIANQNLRVSMHQSKLEVGVEFYCHEGGRRVAHGVVTKITGMHDPLT